VYALVRGEDKAAALRRDEIIPVIGYAAPCCVIIHATQWWVVIELGPTTTNDTQHRDLSKPETYIEYVKQASVIVDNVYDMSETQPGRSNKQLLDLVVEVARHNKTHARTQHTTHDTRRTHALIVWSL
jgi:hypothetical protein